MDDHKDIYIQRKHDIVRMPGCANEKKLKLIKEELGRSLKLKETFNDIDSNMFEYETDK
jgi:hypothetical protein